MADLDDIRRYDNRMDPHRSTIGEERNVLKEIYKEMRKAGIDPAGFRDAKKYGKLSLTKRAARLQTFLASMTAFGYDAQAEMPFGVIQGGKQDEAPAPARAKVPGNLKAPKRAGIVRGKGGLNRSSSPAG